MGDKSNGSFVAGGNESVSKSVSHDSELSSGGLCSYDGADEVVLKPDITCATRRQYGGYGATRRNLNSSYHLDD